MSISKDIKLYKEMKTKQLIKECNRLTIRNKSRPLITVIRIGNNKSDKSYFKSMINTFNEFGLNYVTYEVNSIYVENYKEKFYKSNDKMIVLDSDNLCDMKLKPFNDVDNKYNHGVDSFYEPCTALGILNFLKWDDKVNLKTDKISLIGYGKLVNKPLAKLLEKENSLFCVNRSTTDRQTIIKNCNSSDIIISAVGKYGIVDTDIVNNKDKMIIDCGLSFIDGKQVGDCSKEVREFSNNCTPIRNGVGTLTRLALVENILKQKEE